MASTKKTIDIRKEFPGDEALQQVHLARRALQARAKRKKVTLGEYVRSLKLRPKSSVGVCLSSPGWTRTGDRG